MKLEKGLPGAPWNISDEKAQKELKRFLIIGWAIALVAFFVMGFLAIASIAASGRCILLSWRKVNASKPNGVWLKAASIGLLVFSVLEYITYSSLIKD
jgi:hypothetical protein